MARCLIFPTKNQLKIPVQYRKERKGEKYCEGKYSTYQFENWESYYNPK